MENLILEHKQIVHKIRRISYQIFEMVANESEVIIAGIEGGGLLMAELVSNTLNEISDLKVTLCKVKMDKKNPLNSNIEASLSPSDYQNKSVILVDDVLNSGSTLIYGSAFFLRTPLKRLKTAVLVNRNHKRYPIKADFKGISLSTSLHEHVRVVLNEPEFAVYLD